jgi:Ser/Thr protein kinase RdoA (MazF antagonist)
VPKLAPRPNWQQEYAKEIVPRLGRCPERIGERFTAVVDELRNLPTHGEWFGLAHRDAHSGNFFVDDAAGISLIDFDDAAYDWFANDIAVALFQCLPFHNAGTEHVEGFLRPFLAGYRQATTVPAPSLRLVPTFLKLREIQYFVLASTSADEHNRELRETFLHGRADKILTDVPYVAPDCFEHCLRVAEYGARA